MATLRYHREHVAAVRSGTKRQTIRRAGKVAVVGETLHHQDEKQRPILESTCTTLRSLIIAGPHEWLLDGCHVGIDVRNAIAKADGFDNYTACGRALRRIYGLPLNGQIIAW